MNILILATHLNTGGITSYILTLTRGLEKRGTHVFVASSGGNCVEDLQSVGAQHILWNIKTKSELSPKIYLSLPKLCRLVRQEKIDLIHAHTRVTQVAAFFLSRLTGVPFLSTCHGFFKKRFIRKTFPCWGKAVIAISEPVKKHLWKDFGVPQNKVVLIPNGIDISRFEKVSDSIRTQKKEELHLGNGLTIGIIARLSDVKGHSVLIRAMGQVVQEIKTANLLIVGQGKLESDLKKLADDLGLSKNIHFFPVVNNTSEFLTLFDIFVMPSLQEGLGLSIMEAQAAGIPVIASNVGGIPSLIRNGETGILVTPSDVSALARAMIDLLNDPQKRKELSQRGYESIKKNFSADQMVEQTQNLYERLVAATQSLPSR